MSPAQTPLADKAWAEIYARRDEMSEAEMDAAAEACAEARSRERRGGAAPVSDQFTPQERAQWDAWRDTWRDRSLSSAAYPISEAFVFVPGRHPKRLHDAFVEESCEMGNTIVMTIDIDDDWVECIYALLTPFNKVPLSEALADVTDAAKAKASAICKESTT